MTWDGWIIIIISDRCID